jgi:hypothetical protein
VDCAARLPGKQTVTYLKYNTIRAQEKTIPFSRISFIFAKSLARDWLPNSVHIGDSFVTSASHTTNRQA